MTQEQTDVIRKTILGLLYKYDHERAIEAQSLDALKKARRMLIEDGRQEFDLIGVQAAIRAAEVEK